MAALLLFCERAWVDYPFVTCIGLSTYIVPLINPHTQSQMYLSYKSHNTAKGLDGIAPSEIVTFFSCLYESHIFDKKITQECGFNRSS